ncbi:MAG: FMN-binding protein [Clostridium sp.]|nr:FMN-binding protein [Clostridium sp.]
MKNNKNKILAAVICGVVAGSVGTSFIGDFQKNNSTTTASSSSSVSSNTESPSKNSSTEGNYGERGKDGKGDHHKGAASLDSTERIDVASGSYADGTYEGTADGYSNNLKVQVEVSGGKITDIEVLSHNETPGFCEKAFEQVPASIIAKQSTDVDTVSGATYSSVGIINAVNNALNG